MAAFEGEKKYLIGGNWKCNGTMASAAKLIADLNAAGPIPDHVEVVVGVPALHVMLTSSLLRKDIQIAAQDCGSVNKDGAYTGELSPGMIKDAGCTWVIVGHSERRGSFGGDYQESSALVAKKARAALDAGLKVMICVGETLAEREQGPAKIEAVVCTDNLGATKGMFTAEEWATSLSVAYEPVWAIGTGKTATPEMAQETHAMIRKWLVAEVGAKAAAAVRIQYGGSMKGANAGALLAQPDIDGGLIGGASLTTDFITGCAANCPRSV